MPIPWTAACEYAREYLIDDFDRFWSLMRAMDGAFMEHLNAKKPKPSKK